MATVSERDKLFIAEALWEASRGGRTRDWYDGKCEKYSDRAEARAKATKYLSEKGLMEAVPGYPHSAPHPFRLTAKGDQFLKDLLEKSGTPEETFDWPRLREICFPES